MNVQVSIQVDKFEKSGAYAYARRTRPRLRGVATPQIGVRLQSYAAEHLASNVTVPELEERRSSSMSSHRLSDRQEASII